MVQLRLNIYFLKFADENLVVKELRCMTEPLMYFAIFTKGNDFTDFQFASLGMRHFKKKKINK